MPRSDDHPADLGCVIATSYLREQDTDDTIQSHCTECPFDRCVEEANTKRKPDTEQRMTQVERLLSEGNQTGDIAIQLGIRPRLVRYYRSLLKKESVPV